MRLAARWMWRLAGQIGCASPRPFVRRHFIAVPTDHQSSGVRPVCLAIRVSMRGPISSLSWNAKAKSAQPTRYNVRGEPDCRLIAQPMGKRGRPERVWPLTKAIGSCCSRQRDIDLKCTSLAVLQAFGDNSKCENLGPCHSVIGGRSVGKHAGQLWNLGKPTSVLLLLTLYAEVHRRSPRTTCRDRTARCS